ncbi:vWA domain-containing protein [Winogradskyella arenosi]|uniref:VWA domain-containing protein n=1 Tax=Winogradskyella arenosi TaxID=533325 RepID=A0A368ZCJ3_9FLAO|nr:VWA domain-containing protein [Winogradskyella arenosi]RCW90746.1 hypothetical protein DFQ08_104145 [Winogradskyella arenosi]
MSSLTLLYITIAAITALVLALFQYIYKSKLKSKLKYVLTGLRALVIFGILLVLINPTFKSFTYFHEKPTLVLAVDDSESIAYLNQEENAQSTLKFIEQHKGLQERFNLQTYRFGKEVNTLDSLNFKSSQTNISAALKHFNEIYRQQTAPVVLLTDGNQTFGSDYIYQSKHNTQAIYPVILGDSMVYSDVSLKQVNTNRYVYLKNKFPVEIIANYNGNDAVETELKIWAGNAVVFKKTLKLNPLKSSEIVSAILPANSIGVKTYKVELIALKDEKNTVNNSKNFAVEVIDQKTNVAIIYERLHPDIGALKKAIESNEQRSASILRPQEVLNKLEDYQLFILYQPDAKFSTLLKALQEQNSNTFTIAGETTDWNFLNNNQKFLEQKVTNQTENFLATLNLNYSTFIVENLDFESFPPLRSEFGAFTIKVPFETLLYKNVNGITTKSVLLATFEAENTKHAILNGEGLWRWRAQSFLNRNSFNNFDEFISKLVQYLSSNKKRRRLNVDYKSFYNGNDDLVISAQYFNKNFEFDAEASLSIVLEHKEDGTIKEIPMLLHNGNYTVDLSGTKAGSYDFKIKHNSENVSATGSFKILDYNVEQQFLNADLEKLNTLADKSSGKAYFATQTEALITQLLNDNRYQTIQKSTKKIVPLIEWEYLLLIIALCLIIEWFIRKYNGLI